ncbi:KilA-N domain-containing protein [Chromohalobacter sp. 296-RDG]|uniref:KilA-N domain-containing protein n=1 Tax=Chromohalobacter sp. 296-RDG TaxID=2994062 RepID=UPI002468AA2A|nr:KilA-N domain-containing protein [Chromohalobacter sp. 296-RDG]
MSISVAQKNLVKPTFKKDTQVMFNKEGWLNATALAGQYDKRLDHWLDNQETQAYMAALATSLNTRNPGELKITKKGRYGSGTWIHHRLVIPFARWLSPELAVWMDEQLYTLLSGEWQASREASTEFHKEMCEELTLARDMGGKGTMAHHYINESRMLNQVLSAFMTGAETTKGQPKALDRLALTADQHKAIEWLERMNTRMIARGWDYKTRKDRLLGLLPSRFPGSTLGGPRHSLSMLAM